MRIPAPRAMTWLPEIDHTQHSCVERVGIALELNPDLRGQVGLLLERAISTDGRLIWAAICAHHCWLTDRRGHVVETSCGTFAEQQQGLQLLGEPRSRRWIQLQPAQQDRCLRLAASNTLRTDAELIYCPGKIAADQVPSPHYAAIWSHVATQCADAGGWDTEQWHQLEESLPVLFAD